MSATNFINSATSDFIAPLCEATKNLIAPVSLLPNDRLEIEACGEEYDTFRIRPFSVIPEPIDALYWKWVSAVPKDKLVRTYKETYPSWKAQKWIERLPERKRESGDSWTVKATDFNALVINAIWPRERLVFKNDESQQIFDWLILRFANQLIVAKKKADYKVNGLVPPAPNGFVDHPLFPLSGYQRTALFTSIGQEGSGLFMEQGTGKTPIPIARICHEAPEFVAKTGRMYRALIVCPRNIRANWLAEFKKFTTIPGKVTVIRGGKFMRMKTLIEAMVPDDDECLYTAVIVSYESLVNTLDSFKSICPEWELGVLDESHYIKSGVAQRSQAALSIRDNCSSRMVLTGTPYANSIFDYYTQLEFLGKGLSGFSSKKAFREYYGRFTQSNDGRRVVIGFENLPILKERLARLGFFVTKAEALPQLPKKLYDINEVSMTKRQAEVYMTLLNSLIVEIEADLASSENKTITANNILTRLLRLAQITSGFVKYDAKYDDDGNEISAGTIEYFAQNPKLEALVEILKEKRPDQKTIIWCAFVPDIEQISLRLQYEGLRHVTYYGATSEAERDYAVKAFNTDPEMRIFIGNPATCKEGLNLWGYDANNPSLEQKTNCDHAIYYSQRWSMVERAQSEDRIHRRGTRVPVRYTDLVVPNTIDEEIRARVVEKQRTALEISDVREIMKAVVKLTPMSDD